MAEGQAQAGHDIMGLRTWYVSSQVDNFVPVDDIVEPLLQKYGKIAKSAEYSARSRATGWRCRLATAAAPCRPAPASTCSRTMSASICRRCTRSAARHRTDRRLDLGNMLNAAEKCAKAGHPFGVG